MPEKKMKCCTHCNKELETWFDRSTTMDESGEVIEYEDFPFRCIHCGKNVDAPKEYYK